MADDANVRPRNGISPWMQGLLIVAGIFNLIVFVSVVIILMERDTTPFALSQAEALALHLQIFEAFLAALAIGLAVLGFVGFSAMRGIVESRAESVAEVVAKQVATDVARLTYAGADARQPVQPPQREEGLFNDDAPDRVEERE